MATKKTSLKLDLPIVLTIAVVAVAVIILVATAPSANTAKFYEAGTCNYPIQSECQAVAGCTWTPQCAGFATPCGFIRDATSCGNQFGCTWDATSSECTGTAATCPQLTNNEYCAYQTTTELDLSAGYCKVAGDCSGTPTKIAIIRTNAELISIPLLPLEYVKLLSADITWTTSKKATSKVEYGFSKDNLNLQNSLNLQADGNNAVEHKVRLPELGRNAIYYYKITSCAEADNCASSDVLSFPTPNQACFGKVNLEMPNPIARNERVTAKIKEGPADGGLNFACEGKTAYLKENNCNGNTITSAQITAFGNASLVFTAPSTPNTYLYGACVDKDANNNFNDDGEQSAGQSVVVSACIRAQSELTVTPITIDAGRGETARYTITVKNKNTCAAEFELSLVDCPAPAWNCTFEPKTIVIPKASEGTAVLNVKSASTAGLDTDKSFSITAVDLASDNADSMTSSPVVVHYIPSICSRQAPEVIAPDAQAVLLGGSATYEFTIKNQDSCISTYALSANCPSGLACSLNSNSTTLESGGESKASIVVASQNNTSPNSYAVILSATSSADSKFVGKGTVNHKIKACADKDFDGYYANGGACGEVDCDDSSASVNPGVITEEINGKDDNCDGRLDTLEADEDGDGITVADGDCDDMSEKVNPTAAEICTDNIDNNCKPEDDTACDGAADNTITKDMLNPDSSLTPGDNNGISDQVFQGEGPDGGTLEAGAEVKKSGFSVYLSIPIALILAVIGLVYKFYIKPRRELANTAEMQDLGPESNLQDAQNFVNEGLAEGAGQPEIHQSLADAGVPQAKIEKALKFSADDMAELDNKAKKRKLDETQEYSAGKKYVADMANEGYAPVQIKTALTNAGWPEDLIEKLIGLEVKDDMADLAKKYGADKVGNKADLKKFIRAAIRAGHTKKSIKQSLKKFGWDYVSVNF
ncbi:MAG TPA: hypothetical protein HA224_02975 [Nanoarchaeota archaeon]|nr:hypothetical protein [Nanoarchaeota archaeon]